MKALWLLVALAAACGPFRPVPIAPAGSLAWAVQTRRSSTFVTPPSEYQEWWNDLLHQCTCKPVAPLDLIAIQQVPGNTFECNGGHRCYGAFVQGYNILFIAAAHNRDRRIVQHEMLHAILGRADHPALFRQLGLSELD